MRINIMRVIQISLILTLINLQGCMNVATSAASTGAQAVYNRQSLKKTISDQYITLQAYREINHNTDEFKDTNIAIATFNGEVLLAGQAPKEWQKLKVERIVKQIPDVKRVYNLLTISSPSSTLTRMSDAWITTKVKSQFIASDDLDATQIKVVTENSTVYLMGILPPEDAVAAVDIASNTDGVTKVVKIFSYIHISKNITSSS